MAHRKTPTKKEKKDQENREIGSSLLVFYLKEENLLRVISFL